MELPFVVDILLHILILFVVLTVIFVKVISPTAADALNGTIIAQSQTAIRVNLDQIPASQKLGIANKLRYYPIANARETLSKPDVDIQSHNQWVMGLAVSIAIMVLGVIIAIVASVRYNCGQQVDMKKLLIENALIFIGIGIIEYFFFIKIASKYIPLPPSQITADLANSFTSA